MYAPHTALFVTDNYMQCALYAARFKPATERSVSRQAFLELSATADHFTAGSG
jgi:hypothetical protein